MLIVLTLILAAVILLLIAFENERITKAKHRAQTRRLLNHISTINLPRLYQLEANAAGDRWQN